MRFEFSERDVAYQLEHFDNMMRRAEFEVYDG
jgi:hypothetical protein